MLVWLRILLRSRSAVDLVGVQLVGAPTRAFPSPDAQGRDRIQLRSHQRAVVAGGTGQNEAERRAARVGDEVALGARLTAIRRVRAGGRPPFLAGTLALSTLARLQSISPAACRHSSSTLCRCCHAPTTCQSRSRRQQFMPQPHFISAGSISQGMPEHSTNRMPVRAARSSTRGRPPFGREAGAAPEAERSQPRDRRGEAREP